MSQAKKACSLACCILFAVFLAIPTTVVAVYEENPGTDLICDALNFQKLNKETRGHLLWFSKLGSFVPDTANGGTQWLFYDDGSLGLKGRLRNASNSNFQFEIDFRLTGRVDPGNASYPPAGSPKKELPSTSYIENGGPIDPGTWTYYTMLTGSLKGKGAYAGLELSISRRGPSGQIGDGANGKNHHYGFSNWFNLQIVSQANDQQYYFESIGYGDINGDFHCEFPEEPVCEIDVVSRKTCDAQGQSSAKIYAAYKGVGENPSLKWELVCDPNVVTTNSSSINNASTDVFTADISFSMDAVNNPTTKCTASLVYLDPIAENGLAAVTLGDDDDDGDRVLCSKMVELKPCDPIKCEIESSVQCEESSAAAFFSGNVSDNAQGTTYSWTYDCGADTGKFAASDATAQNFDLSITPLYQGESAACTASLEVSDSIGRKAQCGNEVGLEGCGEPEVELTCDIQITPENCGANPGGAKASLSTSPDISQLNVNWSSDCGGVAHALNVAGDNASADLALNDFPFGSDTTCSINAAIDDGKQQKIACGDVVTIEPCEIQCNEVNITTTQAALDGGAKAFEKLIRRGTKALRLFGEKRLANKINKRIHQLQYDNWVLSWTFDSVQKDCGNTQICTSASNKQIVDTYKSNNDRLLKNARRVSRLLRRLFNDTRTATFVLKKGKRKHKELDQLSDTVPAFTDKCE